MSKLNEKYNDVRPLYEDYGMSIGDIAKLYHVSRQCMHAVLKKRGTVFRPRLKKGNESHFWRGTNDDDVVQNMLEYAIKKGTIVRKEQCEDCGSNYQFRDGRSAIQSHHPDYNEPYTVMWLCQKCHYKWHRENIAIPRVQ